MSQWIELDQVVLDPTIYPRARMEVNDYHVNELVAAIRAGGVMPAITVEQSSLRVVDGWHRVYAAREVGDTRIAADVKKYANEAALFQEAMAANTAHGNALTTRDKIHAAIRAAELGLDEVSLASALRWSIAHLRAVAPLYATVEEATAALPELRKVEETTEPVEERRKVEEPTVPVKERRRVTPVERVESRKVALKRSLRHLEGRQITTEQAAAIEAAPGQSYLLTVRQLISALEYALLPSSDQHPVLWTELRRLRQMLNELEMPD